MSKKNSSHYKHKYKSSKGLNDLASVCNKLEVYHFENPFGLSGISQEFFKSFRRVFRVIIYNDSSEILSDIYGFH